MIYVIYRTQISTYYYYYYYYFCKMTNASTSDLNALIVDDPSSVSVKDVYIGERETLSSRRNSLDVDL